MKVKSQKRPAADAAEEAAVVAAAEARLMEREEEEENEISFHILCFHSKFLQHTLFRRNIGGYAPVYEQMREADPNQEIKVIQKLRGSQAHCVRAHHGRLAQVIQSLFSDTEDELTNTVKKLVFDVEGGKAILASDHPIMIELAKLSKDACAHRLACLCLAFDAASSFQSPLTSFLTPPPPSSRRRFSRMRIRSIVKRPHAWASKPTSIRKPSPTS